MDPIIKIKQNYTPNDVGSILGVHHNTIKNWIKNNQVLAFQTVGGHYRVPRIEVARLIQDRGLPVPEELQGPMSLVYVVDDDEFFRKAIGDALEDEYDVYTFSNGFDALMQIGRLKPDLLLLDIYMPEMDGYALVKKIRQDEKLHNVKILGISGKGVKPDEAKRAGFDDFQEKKEGLENIIEMVRKYVKPAR